MVELVVLSTGLCGYVPQYDAAGDLTSFDVYLVDASRSYGVSAHEHKHLAGIVVHKSYKPSSRNRDRKDLGDYYLYPIENEHVWLQPAGSKLTVFHGRGDHRVCPESLSDTFSYRWVPPMRRITGSQPHGDLSSRIGQSDNNLVAGAVHFAAGVVMTGGLSSSQDGKISRWVFMDGPNSVHTQAVAETVAVYRNLGEAERVRFCFGQNHGGDCSGYLDVEAKSPDDADRKEIVAWVKNQPKDSLVPGPSTSYQTRNKHFAHLGRFLTANKRPWMRRNGICRDLGDGPPLCRPHEKVAELRNRFSFAGDGAQALPRSPVAMVNNPQCPGADYDYL